MPDRLLIEPRAFGGVASVMARKGVDPAAIGAAIGLEMPAGPRATFAGTRTAIGAGPGAWLVLAQDAAPDFAETLAGALSGLASISDQSGSYVVQRVSGPGARTLLQRAAPIDVHPDMFGPGSAATTVIAHIGVMLWQVDDRPSYDIAIFRSYAESFGHWLAQTVAAL